MHVSLYRKYRPQSFAEVVGQAHVTQTLKRAITEKRVAHAFLFSGPRGTGKTSSARILAKALNCEKGGEEPCNECSSCLQVTEGASLDVVEIDAASNGSVDDARDLREKVAYAPVGGRWKVYIVDECHMLSPAANNALLKVLEEPPAHVVFVFATTEPQKVLHTLVDRCQRYDFRAVGASDIAERVQQVCDAEGIWIEQEALGMVGARAAGSVRDGLSLLDQLRSFAGEKISGEAVAELLGQLPEDLMFEALDLVAERDAPAMFAYADRLIRSGSDVRLFTHALVAHLRSVFLVIHTPAAQEILDISDERIGRLQAQANRFTSEEILRLLDLANETQLQLRQGIEGRLAVEIALARMARPDLHATPSTLLSRIEALERNSGVVQSEFAAPAAPPAMVAPGAKAPTAAPLPAATPAAGPPHPTDSNSRGEPAEPSRVAQAAPSTAQRQPPAPATAKEIVEAHEPDQQGPVDIEKVQRAWPIILDKVKRRKISFQALLLAAHPVAYRENELILEFGPRSRFHKDRVSQASTQEPLVEAFIEVFGQRPRIRCVSGEERPDQFGAGIGNQPAAPESPPDSLGLAPSGPAGGAEAGPQAAETSEGSDEGSDQATAAIEMIREAFAGAEVVDDK
ncbi:MAG: DNA polymerase III subunit gamma/tau [Actinomycetota bacterium]